MRIDFPFERNFFMKISIAFAASRVVPPKRKDKKEKVFYRQRKNFSVIAAAFQFSPQSSSWSSLTLETEARIINSPRAIKIPKNFSNHNFNCCFSHKSGNFSNFQLETFCEWLSGKFLSNYKRRCGGRSGVINVEVMFDGFLM